MTLKTLCFNLWKTKYERKGIHDKFIPEFARYIGIEDDDYPNVLKTLQQKVTEDNTHSILFDCKIPTTTDINLIRNIQTDLLSMDVTHLSTQDITMFENPIVNKIFLESLEYTVNLAIKNENFINAGVRNNFIIQLMLYTFVNIRPLNFDDINIGDITYKCIYFGNINRLDIYFLIMLYHMTFDVIYINPLKNEYWDEIDTDHLSKLIEYQRIMPVSTLNTITQTASVIQINESMTLQFEQQLESELFTNTGLYKPWQLRGYNTAQMLIKGNTIDLNNNWNVPAKVRTGFNVTNNTVTIPHMFYKIDGVDANITDYKKTINICTQAETKLEINKEVESLLRNENTLNQDAELQLAFCQLTDGSFSIDKLKTFEWYPFAQYSKEAQMLIINKLNELIKNPEILNKTNLQQPERLHIAATILNMRKEIQRLIDGFDFSSDIPKIIYYLPNESSIDYNDSIILALLALIGFDIVVFSPAGQSRLNEYIDSHYLCDIRLEKMNYTTSFNDFKTLTKKSKGFLSKFFS